VKEFSVAQQIFRDELGLAPVLMRVPYGIHWFGTGTAQKQLALVDVLWTVIGHDWEWSAEQVAEFVLSKASPAAIICLHDGRDIHPLPDIETTLCAVSQIVPALSARGFAFETVSGLLEPDLPDLALAVDTDRELTPPSRLE
jgi:peptidoglycan/xylan/chitin deacetylase (PgdA/CDA1 family)